MSWVEVGCAGGLRPLVVGLWWLGCWVVVIGEVRVGLATACCGGFRLGLRLLGC